MVSARTPHNDLKGYYMHRQFQLIGFLIEGIYVIVLGFLANKEEKAINGFANRILNNKFLDRNPIPLLATLPLGMVCILCGLFMILLDNIESVSGISYRLEDI